MVRGWRRLWTAAFTPGRMASGRRGRSKYSRLARRHARGRSVRSRVARAGFKPRRRTRADNVRELEAGWPDAANSEVRAHQWQAALFGPGQWPDPCQPGLATIGNRPGPHGAGT